MSTEVNDCLKILANNHKQWLRYAENITSNSDVLAEDLVQDFYLSMHNKLSTGKLNFSDISYNSEPNQAYIYKSLKNLFIDGLRKNIGVEINYNLTETLKANNEPYIDMDSVIDKIVDEFYWFDKKLFNLYRKKFNSIRKLSEATNISHVVVWKTINQCITVLKKKINEKYGTG